MTIFRNPAGGRWIGRAFVSALGLAGLLATLAACAAGDVAGNLATPASATAAAPAAPAAAPTTAPAAAPAPAVAAAAAAPATTTAAAPKPAPTILTPTEINEQCWMSGEVNKMKDLDAKAKYVDKCVAEKMKAQGM